MFYYIAKSKNCERKKEEVSAKKKLPLKVSTENGRLGACIKIVKLIFENNDLSFEVRNFLCEVHSTSVGQSIQKGGLNHMAKHYFRGFNYIYYRICSYFGRKAVERFYRDVMLAFWLDMRDDDEKSLD
jgi:hypothetical protein